MTKLAAVAPVAAAAFLAPAPGRAQAVEWDVPVRGGTAVDDGAYHDVRAGRVPRKGR